MTAEILPTVEIVPSSGIVSNDALEKEWQKRFRVKRSGNSKGHLTTQWQSAELNRAIHVEIAEVTDNVFEVTLRPTREWAQVRFKGMATLQIGDSTEMSAFRLYLGDESLDEPGKHSSLKP